jgi:mRNA interferase HigB
VEILNSRLIDHFVQEHADSRTPLREWVKKTTAAQWETNADVQKTFRNVDHLGGQKFISNIGGNKYRLAAMVWIVSERVYVLKIMTHADYDREKF